MKRRPSTSCAIGMAAVITVGAAAELAAQQSGGTSRDGSALSFDVAGADRVVASRHATVFTGRERTNVLPIALGATS